MIGSLQSPYPLQNVSDNDLKELCRALWGWELCENCQNGQLCSGAKCAWKRSAGFESYFSFYKDTTASYVPELLFGSQPALRSHRDVVDIIRLVKERPNDTRSQLTRDYFSQRDTALNSKPPPAADQHRAFNIVVKIMTMVNCSAEQQPSGLLELGTQPIPWHNDTSFSNFLSKAFPKTDLGDLHIKDDAGKSRDVKLAITARRLERLARLSFRGTDDLRNHLRLDSRNGVVEVYHYTSVLKENLAAAATAPSVVNIPTQIALEALYSLQMILFPFDTNSELILRSLVAKGSFDPDAINYDFADYGDDSFRYSHFGSRLMELYDEVENPSPRGVMERWFQRKSGARYVMMATFVGVIIAVILGILSLAVGIFQSWVAYEAWKHPVMAGD